MKGPLEFIIDHAMADIRDLEKTCYKVINIEQGTTEWLEMRRKYITASQIPVIMGVSPYQTFAQLLNEKLTGKEANNDDKKELFQRGHDLENTARNILRDYKFKPMVLVSKQIPELMASLDGMDLERNIILEAKYVGKAKLSAIKNLNIPASHLYQMQAQLMVSGAEACLYFATDGDKYHKEFIKPNLEMFEQIKEVTALFSEALKERVNGNKPTN